MKTKRPRLTAIDRVAIEAGLSAKETPYAIAGRLGKNVRSITREILKRLIRVDKHGLKGGHVNRCIHSESCGRRGICADCHWNGSSPCARCGRCNKVCNAFVEKLCTKLRRSPYVCNGCDEQHCCALSKKYYRADKAEKNYRELLVESRKGANITEEEVARFDVLLKDLTDKGQSLHAIMVNNPELFPFCEKTLYRLVNGQVLSVKRGDLPRACKLKPRRSKPQECKIDKLCRVGRTYADYKEFLAANPGTKVVEMDTVEGTKGGKVLLTLIFMPFDFMVAILLKDKTSMSVTQAFEDMFLRIRKWCAFDEEETLRLFRSLFPVILTDRGTEFSNPGAIERADDASMRTRLFYCDAGAAFQKPHVERNHENIRKVLPKGNTYFEATSFDNLEQKDMSLLMSHVNSYPRKSNSDETPFDMFAREHGERFMEEVFGIVRIEPNEVTLKPCLLGIETKLKKLS